MLCLHLRDLVPVPAGFFERALVGAAGGLLCLRHLARLLLCGAVSVFQGLDRVLMRVILCGSRLDFLRECILLLPRGLDNAVQAGNAAFIDGGLVLCGVAPPCQALRLRGGL